MMSVFRVTGDEDLAYLNSSLKEDFPLSKAVSNYAPINMMPHPPLYGLWSGLGGDLLINLRPTGADLEISVGGFFLEQFVHVAHTKILVF